MHTNSLIWQKVEEPQNKILHCDISTMVTGFGVNDDNKDKLEKMLKRFVNRLCGEGLGDLHNIKPAQIKFMSEPFYIKGNFTTSLRLMNKSIKKNFNNMTIVLGQHRHLVFLKRLEIFK